MITPAGPGVANAGVELVERLPFTRPDLVEGLGGVR
jgi:hypothetical protein